MRRLQRLRGSASALSTCSAPSIRTPPSTRLATSPSPQIHTFAARPTRMWQSGAISVSPQRRCLSTSVQRAEESGVIEPALDDEGPTEIETDLVYPSDFRNVPRPDDVTDPDYVPADSAVGLEEVGGIEGWWDRPGHWGPSKQYVGFGPQEKETDPALLEVLTKQAIVEAIGIKKTGMSLKKVQAMRLARDKEELYRLIGAEIVAEQDGSLTLKTKKQLGSAMGAVLNSVAPAHGGYTFSAEEAKELIKSWDPSWKAVPLADPVVRFLAVRRIQQSTGHIVSDGKLMTIKTIGALVAHLAQPPKAKRLVDEIQAKGILSDLPNVQVFRRRVGPVDKERMVGRWKIIERELQKRNLPALGTGGYRKTVEKSWVLGGV